MKKILQLVLLFVFSIKLFGQLDREHWFAPMMDRSGQSNPYQSIYMSTNEVTPFKVDIFSNNKIIGTVMISKNNPGKYNITDSGFLTTNREQIITTRQSDLFKPISKGIYLKGDKPFFATLRFSVNQHAEIVTSKGAASLGTDFYATPAPIESNLSNVGFMTSIMATVDGTIVNIDNFNPSVRFSDGVPRSNFTINLNRGESYIIDGRIASGGNVLATNPNKYGFIGARITSNAEHPITVTNGNFNGQYVLTTASSTDILMDQSVPIDKLGTEFILVKGNGTIYQPGSSNYSQNMEKAFIVATVNGTNLYVNNESTPVNPIPLNAGEHFVIPSEKYITQGGTHRNMYIKSTQNIYVFQLLAGASSGNEIATGGYNYIPPLSCYLPREIDEIAKVSENEGYIDNSYNPNGTPTKLNIITEKGAIITVEKNGMPFSLIPSDGPYGVTGNTGWVTYSILRNHGSTNDVSGNIKVKSTKAVTAGISAGDGAVGYGGYFAGFSFIPAIVKTQGDCLDGTTEVKLEITEGFDMYQWEIKDNSGVFVNAPVKPGINPATSLPYTNNGFTYFPAQAGIYRARIKQGSCAEVTTQEFKFYNCTTYTNYNYETCKSITITPKLSLSSQNYKPSTLKIDTPPLKGTAVPQPDGTILYISNPGFSGIDTFKYSFCGDGAIPDCEVAQASILLNQIVGNDTVFEKCSSSASTTFDLRDANVTGDTTVSKAFYKSQLGAQNQTASDRINNFANYPSSGENVFVRMVNSKSCIAIQKIELKVNLYPVVQENLYTQSHCDEDDTKIDGNYIVNPNNITPSVVATPATFTIHYYDSSAKAEAGGTDFIPRDYTFTETSNKIWIRVESSAGCATVKGITLKIGNKIPLLTKILNQDVCDKGFDNTEDINLANYLQNLTSQTGLTPNYYLTMPDALEGNNAVSASQTVIRGTVSTFYYVLKNASFCSDVATVNFNLIDGGFATKTIQPTKTICETATTEINAGTAHDSYDWFSITNPSQVIPSTQKVNLGPGKYYVILTSPNGCEYKQNFEIIGSPKAILDISKLNATFCDNQLKGQIDVKFSTQVTQVILQNPHPDIKMEYYRDAAYTQLINSDNFSYNADARVYVRAVSAYCSDTRGFIDFKIGNKVALSSVKETIELCDDDLDGKFKVSNLNDYIKLFTTNPDIAAKFYVKESDAKIESANNITEIDVNNQQILHIRFYDTTGAACPNLGELTIKIKVPKKSDLKLDKTICPDDKTDIQASFSSADFQFYDWYDETDTSTVIRTGYIATDLPVGKYFVILTGNYPNDCPYKQSFEIKAAELPEIDAIEISGSTIKIIASGGRKPYRYAVDGSVYQDSNVFTNLEPGLHKAYVVSADNCDPMEKEFSVIKIYNLITPNDDGVNDVLDMSLLKYKENVKFQIFDRVGKKLFEGDTSNNFIWDGKLNGKPLQTSSYWYIMEWQDFVNSPPVKYSGWILLKNRNME